MNTLADAGIPRAPKEKRAAQFYTPRCVVRVLVEMLAPYNGRVYDPCCGSGGMFVQSVKFIESHRTGNGNGGKAKAALSIYGQESNHTTWRLAKMNLAIRGIDANLGAENVSSFTRDLHKDLKADFVLANPPFNDSDWGSEQLKEDTRWRFGAPPAGNANFAWVQHFIHHLAPNGFAGFVLANGWFNELASGRAASIRMCPYQTQRLGSRATMRQEPDAESVRVFGRAERQRGFIAWPLAVLCIALLVGGKSLRKSDELNFGMDARWFEPWLNTVASGL